MSSGCWKEFSDCCFTNSPLELEIKFVNYKLRCLFDDRESHECSYVPQY